MVRKKTKRVERLHVREKRRKISLVKTQGFRWSVVVAGLIFITSVIYFFFFSATFQIEKINVEHDRVTVQTNFNSDFFSDLIGKNIFLVSSSDVAEILSQVNSSIRSISLKRKFPRILNIELEGHVVIARTSWYGSNYYITEDGYLVSSSGDDSLVLPFIQIYTVENKVDNDESEEDENLFTFGSVYSETFTERIVDPDDLEKILKLLQRFRSEFEIEVLDATYFHVAHEVSLRTLSGTVILFDLMKSLDNQFYKLHALERKSPLRDGIHSRVDLRIGEDRIYYVE